MLLIIYHILLCLLLPLALYKLHWPRKNKPKVGKRWPEHLGISKAVPQVDVWFHCVSVGEVIAATPLIKQAKQQQPELQILLTTTTATGAKQVQQRLSNEVVHRYAPFDLWPCIYWFLRLHQPKHLWIMETELWLNWLRLCQQKNIPSTLINARLSARSLRRYQQVRPFSSQLFANLSQVLAQHQDDAERFRQLGLSSDKVQVTGSIKYDLADSTQQQQQGEDLRQQLFPHRPVWIAASTHKGEEECVLQIAQQLRTRHPDALLILVPRHPERFDAVANLLEQQALPYTRRSQAQAPTANTQVYLADSMGELMQLYAAADVAYIGGSLVPIGGHNYLEAAALKLPCVAGMYDFNFSDISQQLQQVKALSLSDDPAQLAIWIGDYFNDESYRQQVGQKAYSIVQENRGAIKRTLQYLK